MTTVLPTQIDIIQSDIVEESTNSTTLEELYADLSKPWWISKEGSWDEAIKAMKDHIRSKIK